MDPRYLLDVFVFVIDYRLVMLTHGGSRPFVECLTSFLSHASVTPGSVFVHVDGPPDYLIPELRAAVEGLLPDVAERVFQIATPPEGFCKATRRAWQGAIRSEHHWPDWVFWLEHDFVFTERIPIEEMAATLTANPNVTQMALYRDPVNDDEVRAGGFIAQAPGWYLDHGFWQETTRNWTTNPSLIPRRVIEENEWPTVEFCEGVFGFQVRDRFPGSTFGIWGDGVRTQTSHIGERTGFGY